MLRSEIRNSQINALLNKAQNKNFNNYLSKLTLKKVRGFRNEIVSFDFPVTAIIGPNGGGKTTVLGAAACAYKDVSPKRFFAKVGVFDTSMQDWSIEYELIDRELNPREPVRRTSSFRNSRWNREALQRTTLVFGVNRTVPANERSEFSRYASQSLTLDASRSDDMAHTVLTAAGRILGKDIAGFKSWRLDHTGNIVLLTGRTRDGTEYSEFHFGAGESSIIKMIIAIESAPEQSLVLIEEIENGLHPVATVAMVDYLIEVAERKKIQSIFTTHSNAALIPLPAKAIWVANKNKIFQGKLDIESLRSITGQVDSQLVIFVEDRFSQIWVHAILRQYALELMDIVEVHAMEGDGMAVAINKSHNQDPSTNVPSICLIDGDSMQSEMEADGVFRLTGHMPETTVFDETIERGSELGGKLAVALLQRFEHAANILDICREVRISCMDPHLIFAQVGARLGLIPEETISSAFATVWAQAYPEKIENLITLIREKIAQETDG